MADLNATAGALLGFLNRGPLTGWQVAEQAELELCDFWKLTRSQIYRELAALAAAGLIEAGTKGVREQVPYTITAAGRAAFQAWLHEDPGPDVIRSPFHLRLTFANDLDPATRGRFVRLHRARNEERLAYYQRLDREHGEQDPLARLMIRSGSIFREGVLAWLDTLPWGGR